ncbi:MAG: hypothetical protein U1F48_20115 [Burkholderiales bacterium]
MRASLLRRVAGAFAVVAVAAAHAAPPTPERVMELCNDVESPAHCGRKVEAEQLKALPNLATRVGDTLKVSLYPSGTREFVDSLATDAEKSYALWDYWSPVNAVVLFVASGETISYAVLQRATGTLTAVPAEPFLAQDRQRVAIADFCPKQCANELSVWRVTREGLVRELVYKPPVAWADVTVAWKDPDTLTVTYQAPGADAPRTVERKLTAADWRKAS